MDRIHVTIYSSTMDPVGHELPFLVTRLILFSREIPRAVSCGKAGELRFAPNENDPWRRDGADRYRGSFYRFEKHEG
jgi:hypothetical protein